VLILQQLFPFKYEIFRYFVVYDKTQTDLAIVGLNVGRGTLASIGFSSLNFSC